MPVGNDIIDLNRHSVQHRHTDERFIQKILHAAEIELLKQSSNPSYFLWMLWTLKEAAYKYCKQVDSSFVFSPKKIFIQENNFNNAFALIKEADESFIQSHFENTLEYSIRTSLGILKGFSVFSKNYIHSVAVKDEGNVFWGIKKIIANTTQMQSDEVRNFALASMQPITGELFFLEKIPFIKVSGKTLATSLSHDGYYVSFAVKL